MRAGFVHGVMNTDNMSIPGLTIDYGPYGWLDGFDPEWTPNTTDAEGRRYRYGHQPQIAQWNLVRLAGALIPLVDDTPALERGLAAFGETFESEASRMLAGKLGLRAQPRRRRQARRRSLRGAPAGRDRHDAVLSPPGQRARRSYGRRARDPGGAPRSVGNTAPSGGDRPAGSRRLPDVICQTRTPAGPGARCHTRDYR